jgi:hypothetical protein
MNITIHNTYIKATVVYGCIIEYTPEVKIEKKGVWPWSPTLETKTDKWTLKIDYLREDGKKMIYTAKSENHQVLADLFKDVMNQIRDQDNQFADKALEDAIINGGTK